jgi:hypothetical protein
MERLVSNERVKEKKAKLAVTLANIFVFTPIAWYFMSAVPVREIDEVTIYSTRIVKDFLQEKGLWASSDFPGDL